MQLKSIVMPVDFFINQFCLYNVSTGTCTCKVKTFKKCDSIFIVTEANTNSMFYKKKNKHLKINICYLIVS